MTPDSTATALADQQDPLNSSAPDAAHRVAQLLFRFRYMAHCLIYGAGFAAAWLLPEDATRQRVWLWLPGVAYAHLNVDLQVAIVIVTSAAIAFSLTGAMLRTWGTAYLDAGVVFDRALRGDRMTAEGPYRYVRNPLYLGTISQTLALAMLMTPLAAAGTIVAIVALQFALIAAEERYLEERHGEEFRAYRRRVPMLLPSLRPRLAAGTARPRWGAAFLGEIFMWGTALSFAVFGWQYNALLLGQAVLVSFGASIVARGLMRSS